MIGLLLTNIGTPDAPSPAAVRRYLREFLSDRRVVELPRIIWYPILYGAILPLRARQSAKLYQNIWQSEGSPLLIHSQQIAIQLQKILQIPVELGMHYGTPSIQSAMEKLRAAGVTEIKVLPLYPQYSATTTASAYDAVTAVLRRWRALPAVHLLGDYADHPDYIAAISDSIQQYQMQHGKKFLLFSFHGIPQRYVNLGDPYAARCQLSAEHIVRALGLTENEYQISFQSRLGKAKWLTPYTDKVLAELPPRGIKEIQVVCPGFAVDCLETLEEIALRGHEQFMETGGVSLEYIPALNASEGQMKVLTQVLYAAGLPRNIAHTPSGANTSRAPF